MPAQRRARLFSTLGNYAARSLRVLCLVRCGVGLAGGLQFWVAGRVFACLYAGSIDGVNIS
eukprot:1938134-Alexandrium_andersonii.AAC.1